jgi:hypothetical protein
LERWVAELNIEPKAKRVTQDDSQQTIEQMPHVAGPEFLSSKRDLSSKREQS